MLLGLIACGVGVNQGYASATSQAQSQWASPATQNRQSQQWGQSPTTQQDGWGDSQQQQPQQQQQVAGAYNPGVYGVMPGAYGQGHSASANQPSNPYSTQQQDLPPPPPPKPYGFAKQQQQHQQQAQSWGQQPGYTAHTTQDYHRQSQTGFSQGQSEQAVWPPHGVVQPHPQQQYNSTAPPPPSATPGGSYFPPSQQGTYTSSTPASATTAYPPPSILSPDAQHPTYIPPSLTGQGVQSYMPANTNPLPGVYVPPPPDMPAWQQASHAPLQGGDKKFRYTKPMVDPSFQPQGYQVPAKQPGQFSRQPPPIPHAYAQPVNQYQTHPQIPQKGQHDLPQGQFQQQPQDQFQQPQDQFQQQPQQYGQPMQQPDQVYSQQASQWQQPTATEQGYSQYQQPPVPQWPAEQVQASVLGHHDPQTQDHDQGIQAPKPIDGQTGTAAPKFVSNPSPTSQPVSPVHNRNSMNFGNTGRAGSVSSIALGAIQSQRAGNRTNSPASIKASAPPPIPEEKQFSALAFGGPSDWEHFGDGEEIDDEELFGVKKDDKKPEPAHSESVELPAHVPSPLPSAAEWPTPPVQPAPLAGRDSYQPTPPPNYTAPSAQPQGLVMGDAVISPLLSQSPQHGHFAQPPPPQQSQFAQPAPSQQQVYAIHNSRGPSRHGTPGQHQQQYQPPSNQNRFSMHSSQNNSQRGTPTQQYQRYQAPPPAGNTFVADDGNWAAQDQPRQQTPAQHPQQPPPQVWSAGNQASSHAHGAHNQNQDYAAELYVKDEAYERLKHDTEGEKADLRADIEILKSDVEKDKADMKAAFEREKTELRAELERIKADFENTRTHASSKETALHEQIEAWKAAATQAKTSFDASEKEKTFTIARLKEDVEGKDDAIKEKDAAIKERDDAIKEKDDAIADLKTQLEEEKVKGVAIPVEFPRPTPGDLIPDIDPWYIGSLERYIGMLRSEAGEQQVEGKIGIFTSFLRVESSVRGLEYYSAPPAPVAISAPQPAPIAVAEPIGLSRGTSNASIKKPQVQIPIQRQPSPDDDFQYSPGGRPLLPRKPTITSNESVGREHSLSLVSEAERLSQTSTTNDSAQKSAPILTPTSSNDDSLSKGPLQSPLEEPTGQYKAFVPQQASQSDSIKTLHRQSMSFSPSAIAPLHTSKSGHGQDEIFFAGPQPPSKSTSRPTTSASTGSDIPIPAPLSFTPAPLSLKSQTPAVPSQKKGPLQILDGLLPARIAPHQPHARLEVIWKKSSALASDFTYINDLIVAWEKAAALARKKNDAARQQRQEESEEHTDQLFNDNQISYADIGDLEDEFKEKERQLKAQEDRAEYKMYVEQVFDKVYDSLQADIKSLMDLYMESENLLQTSVSGVKTLDGQSDVPSSQEALELLKTLHTQIETRHEKVVQAVAERDKRYKRTEIQPLYAAGNIAKMKTMEKHFDNAEKQAVLRAKGERSERIDELVGVAEDVVIMAVGYEQDEADHILDAARALAQDNADDSHADILTRAHDTLLAIKTSSIALLGLFNSLEVDHNTAQVEVEIAQAKAQSADAAHMKNLEVQMVEGEKLLKDEFERRVGVLEQDRPFIEALVKKKLSPEERAEKEKERRLKAALEEAKRRNGHV
ncbi:hypothetical protein K504DRAFT_255524 [Pleomassaria siparia CBS 279.74]|uniref:Uncharacterized protein n=1 Tax=Pleomassaria siparia CBS 279.74 TaxID=1314801 RepID=A0A6G1KCA5_9PLEO|nr:hypothetical protein K504DRAFT_255524 [Pleomassaria siparia CBS 279.74]